MEHVSQAVALNTADRALQFSRFPNADADV